MPENSCTPENAMGKLGGIMDAGGVEMTNGAFDKLTDNAKLLYQQVFRQDKADILQTGKPEIANKVDAILDETTQDFTADSRVSIKGVVTGSMKPTELFPPELTDPILSYIDDFYVKNGGNIRGKHKEFISGIRSVINSLDDSKVPGWAESEWNHWRRDLLDGSPFYEKKGNEIVQIFNNVTGNAINLSNNVILGNPVEFIVKAPSLYGFTPTLKGVIETLKDTRGNIWGKLPELEARGYYGNKLEPSKNFLKIPGTGKLNDLSKTTVNLIMNTTQRPLLNMSYSVGKLGGGVDGGLEAVEKISFANRLGNRPRLFRNQSSGNSLKLMNYSVSQYQMFGGLLGGLTNPKTALNSARGIATYIGLSWALGGQAAFIPKPISMALQKVDGYKEWEEENLTPVGKLIQPGAITIGAAQSIWNRTVEVAQRDLQSGAKNLDEGNIGNAVGDFTLSALTLSIGFGQNIMTNPRTQRTARSYIDLYQEDISDDEQYQKLNKIWIPFYKD